MTGLEIAMLATMLATTAGSAYMGQEAQKKKNRQIRKAQDFEKEKAKWGRGGKFLYTGDPAASGMQSGLAGAMLGAQLASSLGKFGGKSGKDNVSGNQVPGAQNQSSRFKA